ncbi:MAG TPA: carboxypeptidase-like regulatory domain-containing protein [Pyrinomonadaceae bacterium]|nr:carboxypeptidase-like regulatory domain-containing protein [Pyrinomonadaceae bacterium]
MTKRFRVPRFNDIGATILLLITCVGGFAQTSAPPNSQSLSAEVQSGSITGQVVGERGQPLPGASISIQPINGLQQRIATSDTSGNFKVTNLDPRLYRVSVSLPGYTIDQPSRTEPPVYRIGENVRFQMIRGGVITGKITNAAGEPVILIPVRALRIRNPDGRGVVDSYSYGAVKFTDDRGVYRIYGLVPGTYVVLAGLVSRNTSEVTPYDNQTPTYAPSSTRDTAAEVTVHSGEEKEVDIRYRGELGHRVSGKVRSETFGTGVFLTPRDNEMGLFMMAYQPPGVSVFAITGVPDGEYKITAFQSLAQDPNTLNLALSETLAVSVKGADVTGIELTPKPLGRVSGQIVMVASAASECQGKRKPVFNEMALETKRNILKDETDVIPFPRSSWSTATPNKSGNFELKNLRSGQYFFSPSFFARYWYLQSVTLPSAVSNARSATSSKTEPIRDWIAIKFGDRISGLTLTLAEGAGSVRGKVKGDTETKIPPDLYVYLVPAEREKADDIFRYSGSKVESDGSFALNNLAPGRYWAITQVAGSAQLSPEELWLPSSADARQQLRRDAQSIGKEISIKPCQNVNDYQVILK